MKKSIKLCSLFLLSFLLFGLASCSSDDDGGGSGNVTEGTMAFKVNGTKVKTLKETTFASKSSGTLMIQGNTGGTQAKALSLTLVGFEGEGTYDLGGSIPNFTNASYNVFEIDPNNPMNTESKIWAAPYGDPLQKVGEIKVSEITETYVKGTFTFEGARFGDNDNIIDYVNITEGAFHVKLTN